MRSLLLFAKPDDTWFLPLHSTHDILKSDNSSDVIVNLMERSFDALIIDSSIIEGDELCPLVDHIYEMQPWLKYCIIAEKDCPFLSQLEKNENIHIISREFDAEDVPDLIFGTGVGKNKNVEPISHKGLSLYSDLLSLERLYFSAKKPLKMYRNLIEEATKFVPEGIFVFLESVTDVSITFFAADQIDSKIVEALTKETVDRYKYIFNRELDIGSLQVKTEFHENSKSKAKKAKMIATVPVFVEDKAAGILSLALPEYFLASSCETKTVAIHFFKYLHGISEVLRKEWRMLTHDTVPSLYNYESLRYYLEKSEKENKGSFGTLMLTIDRFKNLNETYGHKVGETVINEMSRLIVKSLPSDAIAARYDINKIAIIIYEGDSVTTEAIAKKLVDEVEKNEFSDSGFPVRITISIGFLSGKNIIQLEEQTDLLDFLTEALDLAVKGGGNQLCNAEKMIKGPDGGKEDEEKKPEEQKQNKTVSLDEPAGAKLLVVDDEDMILQLLKRVLSVMYKYDVTTSNDAKKALEIVKERGNDIDVIISDINMPGMDGIELLKAVKETVPDIVTLVLTGFATTENAIAAVRAGAYDIVQKPFNNEELGIIVKRALERRSLKRQLDAFQLHLQEMLDDKTAALKESIDNLKHSYVETMEAIVTVLDTHEGAMADHSIRVSKVAYFLAQQIGISDPGELTTIKYGALLHDIGKIGISDTILCKPAKLTDEEFTTMKTHSQLGFDIVKTIPILKEASDLVLSHHERFDGRGYPRGIKGKDICIGGRIFALVDTFDALRYGRVYHASEPVENIVKEINNCSGSQFDPDLVKIFNNCYLEVDKFYEGRKVGEKGRE